MYIPMFKNCLVLIFIVLSLKKVLIQNNCLLMAYDLCGLIR